MFSLTAAEPFIWDLGLKALHNLFIHNHGLLEAGLFSVSVKCQRWGH